MQLVVGTAAWVEQDAESCAERDRCFSGLLSSVCCSWPVLFPGALNCANFSILLALFRAGQHAALMHCMQAERDGMATKLAHADSEGVETEVFISLFVCLFDPLFKYKRSPGSLFCVHFQAENDILKTEMSLLQSKLELLEQQLLAKNRARIHRWAFAL